LVDKVKKQLDKVKKKRIKGPSYFYFQHAGKEKPKWHYIGKKRKRNEKSLEEKHGSVILNFMKKFGGKK